MSVGNISLKRAEAEEPVEDDLSVSTTALLMNDTFIVELAPLDNKILIMCFDEDVHIAGATPTGLWEDRTSDRRVLTSL